MLFNNFPKTVKLTPRTTEFLQMLILNRMQQLKVSTTDFDDDNLAKLDENGNHYNAAHADTLSALDNVGTLVRIQLSTAIEDAITDWLTENETPDFSNFEI